MTWPPWKLAFTVERLARHGVRRGAVHQCAPLAAPRRKRSDLFKVEEFTLTTCMAYESYQVLYLGVNVNVLNLLFKFALQCILNAFKMFFQRILK